MRISSVSDMWAGALLRYTFSSAFSPKARRKTIHTSHAGSPLRSYPMRRYFDSFGLDRPRTGGGWSQGAQAEEDQQGQHSVPQ
jgi:hypothetical protein